MRLLRDWPIDKVNLQRGSTVFEVHGILPTDKNFTNRFLLQSLLGLLKFGHFNKIPSKFFMKLCTKIRAHRHKTWEYSQGFSHKIFLKMKEI